MRSLVFVYCIFCLFPLTVLGVFEEFGEDFVDLSVLELLDSDDFLVTELRVEADILLDYLFGLCFCFIFLLFFMFCCCVDFLRFLSTIYIF